MIYGAILAGGSGTRMHISSLPKLAAYEIFFPFPFMKFKK